MTEIRSIKELESRARFDLLLADAKLTRSDIFNRVDKLEIKVNCLWIAVFVLAFAVSVLVFNQW